MPPNPVVILSGAPLEVLAVVSLNIKLPCPSSTHPSLRSLLSSRAVSLKRGIRVVKSRRL